MPLSKTELDVLQAMTPERRLKVMQSLIEQAWSLKAAMIRTHRPDLSEAEVAKLAREAVAGGRA